MLPKNELDYTPLFMCNCGGEGVSVSRLDWDDSPWQLCFTYYSWGHGNHIYSWKDKLRHIWQIITKGHPYQDEITFDKKTAKSFANQILAELEKFPDE